MDKTVEQVEQVDRDAYAREVETFGDKEYADRIRSGQLDTLVMVQAFARHRIEATREVEAERVKLWNENRDLIASIHVEKAATDTMRAQLDEAMEARKRLVKDFRWRADQCRNNPDAYCPKAASVWDLAAEALEAENAS